MTGPDTAIVACSSLRHAVERLAPDVAAAYVPHELHESPLDPGDPQAAVEAVQTAVDRLSAPTRSHIALAYARSCPALDRLAARETPVVAWRAADCADALCGRPVGRFGEAKAPDSYYLTPGAIEAGLDPFKAYRAYRGEAEALIADQTRAGLAVSWHEPPRVAELIDSGPRPDPAMLRDQFEVQFGSYDRVVLLDTGAATAAHRRYACRVASFLARLGEGTVDLEVTAADLAPLVTLLDGDAPTAPGVDVLRPGSTLGGTATGSTDRPTHAYSHD